MPNICHNSCYEISTSLALISNLILSAWTMDCCKKYKNSSGDEIANVNFYAVRPWRSYPNSLK